MCQLRAHSHGAIDSNNLWDLHVVIISLDTLWKYKYSIEL